jgi:hypothetical protein
MCLSLSSFPLTISFSDSFFHPNKFKEEFIPMKNYSLIALKIKGASENWHMARDRRLWVNDKKENCEHIRSRDVSCFPTRRSMNSKPCFEPIPPPPPIVLVWIPSWFQHARRRKAS